MQLNFSPFRYSQFIINFYQAAKGDSQMPRTTTCASWDHNSPVLISKPTNNRIVIWYLLEHMQNSLEFIRISFTGNHLNCDKNLPHPMNLGIMIQVV
ncbi:uncharacterized protein LOC123192185 isoform X3 [Mangifera indica]|uniref:uncharacterized protein LOC123192185 isoform X3 n=1 Tax=Mangifera indica TaxID=29780 RepID=UPI001CFA3253|nr:uncharacterized protein LOC123192185 isoform X3 [Mangifera indica]XP_044460582.1 uncharacterized protein LOC123192185 isoform X3 [Mangifera indica]XP_044460583.1 uncharacterized protein LOC123192185 isoform X3 [Mangifera indica]